MVDQTIAEIAEVLGADLASDDKIPVWDTTSGTTKHIEAYEFAKYLGKSGMYSVSVASFIAEGTTDHTSSFQAAIDSLPDADTIPETLDAGEWPSYSIYVPSLPDGSRYKITDYLTIGKRSLTWIVDDGVRIGGPAVSANLNWAYLNAPIVTERGIHMLGFANKKDHTGFSITMGEGAYNDREAGISGYNPDTVETQAYQHERGRAGLYIAVSDNGQFKYSGATTFTSTGFTIPTAMSTADAGKLRKGMFVDTDGTMTGTGGSTRFTSRLVSWSPESAPTTFVVEQWYKMDPTNPYAAAVTGTPTNGQSVIINPVNKVWGGNVNIFLNETDGATFGYTSSSIWEIGLANNTGTEADNDFNRDDHPFHFYGMDMAQIGSDGGGFPFLARGNATAKWTASFRNIAGKIGFHNDGTSFNDGELGFVSSNGYIGTATYSDGAVAADFLSRTKIGGVYDNNFRIKGGVPTLELGRRNNVSQPVINLFSHGSAANDNDWDAQIGFRSDVGTLYIDRKNAADANNATLLSLYSAGTQKGYFKATTSGIDFQGGDFSVDNTTLFVDKTNDRVGFGISAPTERLHVNGNSLVAGNSTTEGTVITNNIKNRTGQQLILNAGEASGRFTGQTNEYVYVNGEQGLRVSTPDRSHSNFQAGYTEDYAILRGDTLTLSSVSDPQVNFVHLGTASNSTSRVLNDDGKLWIQAQNPAGDSHSGGEINVSGWAANTLGDFNVRSSNTQIFGAMSVGKSTTPTSGYKLDVNGAAIVSGQFVVDTDTLYVRADTDRVGINTSTPSEALDVVGSAVVEGNLWLPATSNEGRRIEVGSNRTGTNYGYAYIDLIGDSTYSDYGLRIMRGNTGPDTYSVIGHKGTGNLIIRTEQAGKIQFDTTGSTRAVITADGKLGIGTTAPAHKLHVVGTTLLDGTTYFGGSLAKKDTTSQLNLYGGTSGPAGGAEISIHGKDAASAAGRIYYTGYSADQQWRTYNGTAYTNLMRLTSTGSLGIGTTSPTSGYKLDVAGAAKVSGQFAVDTDTLLVRADTDRVGINTSAPQEALHVAGTGNTVLVSPISYSSNQDSAYLIAGTSGYTGATTNWNTFGFQHRIKSNASGTPRITIDNYAGEKFSVDNSGAVSITNDLTVGETIVGSGGGTYDPAGGGTGTDTSTSAAFAFPSGKSIVGTYNGYIRNMLSWTSSGPIQIGQGGTSLISEINLSPGNSGFVRLSASGQDRELLRFNTERPWSFFQRNTGASTKLDLRPNVDGKHFIVTTNDGTVVADFSAANAAPRLGVGTDNPAATLDVGGDALISGVLGIGVTSPGAKLHLYSSSGASSIFDRSADGSHVLFRVGGASAGNITTTSLSTTYASTSDYRAKENVVELAGASDTLMTLRPVMFNMIGYDQSMTGFIAHEVAEVVPEAVVGEKDAVDENGEPIYQGIDQSKLVPLLTAALQEAIERIEVLEAKLNA